MWRWRWLRKIALVNRPPTEPTRPFTGEHETRKVRQATGREPTLAFSVSLTSRLCRFIYTSAPSNSSFCCARIFLTRRSRQACVGHYRRGDLRSDYILRSWKPLNNQSQGVESAPLELIDRHVLCLFRPHSTLWKIFLWHKIPSVSLFLLSSFWLQLNHDKRLPRSHRWDIFRPVGVLCYQSSAGQASSIIGLSFRFDCS